MPLNGAQRKLVEENMKLVPHVIKRHIGAQLVFDEDLLSVGYVGLCKAAQGYCSDSGAKFSTYATQCILNALWADYRSRHAQKRAVNEQLVSLDAPILDDNGESIVLKDAIADEYEDTERDAIENACIESVKQIAPNLFKKVYGNISYQQLARDCGVSSNAVYTRCVREKKRLIREFYPELDHKGSA